MRSLAAAQPIHNLRTIREIRDNSLATERLNLTVLAVFALVALSLSVVGLYGVLAYSVARRRREIGVRTSSGWAYAGLTGRIEIAYALLDI